MQAEAGEAGRPRQGAASSGEAVSPAALFGSSSSRLGAAGGAESFDGALRVELFFLVLPNRAACVSLTLQIGASWFAGAQGSAVSAAPGGGLLREDVPRHPEEEAVSTKLPLSRPSLSHSNTLPHQSLFNLSLVVFFPFFSGTNNRKLNFVCM